MITLAPLFERRNRALWIAGGAAFAFAALASAPASLAALLAEGASHRIEAGAAEGTIWRGEISSVSYDKFEIGTLVWRVRPSRLLAGRLVAEFSTDGGALSSQGGISLSPARAEFRDVTARFNLASIRQYTFFGARYQGSVSLAVKRLALSAGGCLADDARVATDALDTMARRWSGGTFPLQGDVKCVGDKLIATLGGENAEGAIDFVASVSPDFAYSIDFSAEPRRAEIGEALRRAGFEGDGARLSWRAVGQLKGLSS